MVAIRNGMEPAMMTYGEVLRRIDGSIDIDFYRAQGLAERREVIKGAIRGLRRGGKGLAAVATAMVAVIALLSGNGSA
jgi:hypothetical protein